MHGVGQRQSVQEETPFQLKTASRSTFVPVSGKFDWIKLPKVNERKSNGKFVLSCVIIDLKSRYLLEINGL